MRVLASVDAGAFISTITTSSPAHRLAVPRSVQSAKWYRRTQTKLHRKSVRRRAVRFGLLFGNVAILGVILTFVLQNPHNSNAAPALLSTDTASSQVSNPLDQLSSANIALTVARMSSLPEATAINNQADSQATQLSMAKTDGSVVSKPQVVATALKSRADIQNYVSKAGDSVSGIAAKFGVTSDSIRWSNGLTGDAIAAGVKLVIPPVSGIVYTVKAGDTPATLASKFSANEAQIVAYNDAEISGLQPGTQIIVPNGSQKAAVPTYATSYATTSFAWGGSAIYGGNGYDFGYCTWWAAERRIQIGKPIPTNLGDAWSWKYRAAGAGLSVSNKPVAGAVIWFNIAYPGHVGFVESVNAAGDATISEMNTVGWDRVDTKVIPASQVGNYTYIN